MAGNMENYDGMKRYKNRSTSNKGEGEMGYLRGNDTAMGFKAVNPPFFVRVSFFFFCSLTLFSFCPSPNHIHINTKTNMHKHTTTDEPLHYS